ncbi:MAG: type VI secretion system tip protein VgrG [Bacteroidota bacterium]
MAESSLKEKIDRVTYVINLDGSPMKDEYDVLTIHVERDINKISRAKVAILLPWGTGEDEAFTISEAADFKPGVEMEIKVGYDSEEETIFKGLIVKHGLKSRGGKRSQLIIKCLDEAIKLCLGEKTKVFAEQTDSAIISSVISGGGLSADVESTTYTHKQLFQYQSVDWDFIMNRAEANGLLVYTEDGKVLVKKPLASGSAELKVNYNDDVFDFDGEVDASFQLPSAVAEGWDFASQEFVSGNSEEPSLISQGNLTGTALAEVLGVDEVKYQFSSPMEADELKGVANGALVRSRLSAMRGRVSFFGNSKPKLNTLIQIEGFGERFNGDALITSIRHEVVEGSWRTEVGFGLSPEWYHHRHPERGHILPSIGGLQNGIVKKIDEDPGGEHRIQVNIPVTGADTWARLTTFYTTNAQGIFFMPEVGDEVILGFLCNDPRYPIILGSLYSSKNAPAYTADAENTIKAFTTKAELKIELNDKDKVLTIETPGKNSIVISDKDKKITIKDQNSNTIEMSSDGISLKSGKDVNIEATGKMTLKAAQAITVQSSGGDVALKGLNVNANGQVGAVVKGGATAELSAGGQTTVKGAMVMIN